MGDIVDEILSGNRRRHKKARSKLGGYDIVGRTDIVGGAARGKSRSAQWTGDGRQPRVQARGAGTLEGLVAGVPVTVVPAGAAVDIEVRVDEPFRPRKMDLFTYYAEDAPVPPPTQFMPVPFTDRDILVTDMRIAQRSQFVNSGVIGVKSFRPEAQDVQLRGDTAEPGVPIILRVRNDNSLDIGIEGAIWGWAASPYGSAPQARNANADQMGRYDIVGNDPRVVERQPHKVEELMAGFDFIQIIGQQTLATNVTTPFRVRRLILQPDGTDIYEGAAAQRVRVRDILIGQVSQIINSEPLPIESFAADATRGSWFRGNTAQPGVGIALALEASISSCMVSGGFFGPAAA